MFFLNPGKLIFHLEKLDQNLCKFRAVIIFYFPPLIVHHDHGLQRSLYSVFFFS